MGIGTTTTLTGLSGSEVANFQLLIHRDRHCNPAWPSGERLHSSTFSSLFIGMGAKLITRDYRHTSYLPFPKTHALPTCTNSPTRITGKKGLKSPS